MSWIEDVKGFECFQPWGIRLLNLTRSLSHKMTVGNTALNPSDHPVDPKSGTRSARFDPRPKASKNTETRAEPESAKVIFEQCSDALLYIFPLEQGLREAPCL